MVCGRIVALLASWAVCASPSAQAGPTVDAAKAFADGKALLAKADFAGAERAFRQAAKADARNQEYRQYYAVLRQVRQLRRQIQSEQDANQWLRMAFALRSFYHAHKVYAEALPIDREIRKRRPGADTTAMLAETQIALGMNSKAAETLRSLSRDETTLRTNVLLALALARGGQIDEARDLARKMTPRDDADPRYFLALARLRALTGDPEGTLAALTRSFESTPPSRLDAAKADAKTCKDFGAIAKSAGFARALGTKSKVKESQCSAGAGCGSCPSRGGCPSQGG